MGILLSYPFNPFPAEFEGEVLSGAVVDAGDHLADTVDKIGMVFVIVENSPDFGVDLILTAFE